METNTIIIVLYAIVKLVRYNAMNSSYVTNFNSHPYSKLNFNIEKKVSNVIDGASECEDKDALCATVSIIKWVLPGDLCKIEMVKEQCPKACNYCSNGNNQSNN